jgi:hypothetical protein
MLMNSNIITIYSWNKYLFYLHYKIPTSNMTSFGNERLIHVEHSGSYNIVIYIRTCE